MGLFFDSVFKAYNPAGSKFTLAHNLNPSNSQVRQAIVMSIPRTRLLCKCPFPNIYPHCCAWVWHFFLPVITIFHNCSFSRIKLVYLGLLFDFCTPILLYSEYNQRKIRSTESFNSWFLSDLGLLCCASCTTIQLAKLCII